MKTVSGREVEFTIVSTYAGEQGHLGGGDSREHGTYPMVDLALDTLHELESTGQLDFRTAHVIVTVKKMSAAPSVSG